MIIRIVVVVVVVGIAAAAAAFLDVSASAAITDTAAAVDLLASGWSLLYGGGRSKRRHARTFIVGLHRL